MISIIYTFLDLSNYCLLILSALRFFLDSCSSILFKPLFCIAFRESVAIPHNTMVLFGSYGIVPSSKMFIIWGIASALIAGVIVVVVDWKRLYACVLSSRYF